MHAHVTARTDGEMSYGQGGSTEHVTREPVLVLSPELVLVSPDLAEVARAALPDRPWDLLPLRVTGPAVVPAPTPPGRPESPGTRRQPPRRTGARRPRVALGRAAVLAALAGLAVFSVVAPPRGAPTLIETSTHSARVPAAAPARVARPTKTSLRATAKPSASPGPRQSARPAAASAKNGAAPAKPRATGPQAVPASARATRVHDTATSRHVRFVLHPGGHLIERFSVTLRCAGRVVLTNIAIGRDGTFSVTHRFWGSRRDQIQVWLEGRVVGRRVQGTARVRHYPCATRSVSFAAPATLS